MAGAPSHLRGGNMATARSLFILGWDTQKIAHYWNITEAEAERRITLERSRAKGLTTIFEPSPYTEKRAIAWRDVGNPVLGPLA